MFNLFKPKDYCGIGVLLAKQSKIEPTFENGKITSFFIYPPQENSFVNKIKNKETLTNFVATIEERIKNKEYKDIRSFISQEYLIDLPKDDSISKVLRVASNTHFKPMFSWYPPPQ